MPFFVYGDDYMILYICQNSELPNPCLLGSQVNDELKYRMMDMSGYFVIRIRGESSPRGINNFNRKERAKYVIYNYK